MVGAFSVEVVSHPHLMCGVSLAGEWMMSTPSPSVADGGRTRRSRLPQPYGMGFVIANRPLNFHTCTTQCRQE